MEFPLSEVCLEREQEGLAAQGNELTGAGPASCSPAAGFHVGLGIEDLEQFGKGKAKSKWENLPSGWI